MKTIQKIPKPEERASIEVTENISIIDSKLNIESKQETKSTEEVEPPVLFQKFKDNDSKGDEEINQETSNNPKLVRNESKEDENQAQISPINETKIVIPIPKMLPIQLLDVKESITLE